jgi:hypothetical protein
VPCLDVERMDFWIVEFGCALDDVVRLHCFHDGDERLHHYFQRRNLHSY